MPLLVFALVFATLCSLVANSRGRSAVGWFFIGFFFGLFAFIVLLVLPDLRELEARDRSLREENRMLRERVRSHRMVADQRHAEQARRLDVHDRALGVDTSAQAQLDDGPPASEPPALPPPVAPTQPSEFVAARWRYAFGQEAKGPISFNSLRELFTSGDVTRATLVWTEGMPEWRSIEQMPGLIESLHD